MSAPALPDLDKVRIAVVGLGYVGLPLALAFGRRFPTLGFDIDAERVAELRAGHDRTRETAAEQIRAAGLLKLDHDAGELRNCDVFIVAVPTPIDEFKRPDTRALQGASMTVGRALRPGGIAIFESTVYPGATEEICVPLLERESGLTHNVDFYTGYSPERINPGDREHRLETIVKVTAGSTPAAADLVDALYASIVPAGTHRAPSIRTAEMAKVIENTQRDVNIALVNEVALLCHRLGLDTREVLEAAGTKWNFLRFQPGLVGGHCIGVDPYYLTHKAQQLGYHPEVVLSGRRINDSMGVHVAQRVVRLMTQRRQHVAQANVLVLGLAFKENCPDLRNTRVIDVVEEFRRYGANVDVHDPWVDAGEARREYGIDVVAEPVRGKYDAIVVAVGHREFHELGADGIRALGMPECVIFDVQRVLPNGACHDRL